MPLHFDQSKQRYGELKKALTENRVKSINQTIANKIERQDTRKRKHNSHAETLFMGNKAGRVINRLYEQKYGLKIIKITGTRRPCVLCACAACITGQTALLDSPSIPDDGKASGYMNRTVHVGALHLSLSAINGLRQILREYKSGGVTPERLVANMRGFILLNRRGGGNPANITPIGSPTVSPQAEPGNTSPDFPVIGTSRAAGKKRDREDVDESE